MTCRFCGRHGPGPYCSRACAAAAGDVRWWSEGTVAEWILPLPGPRAVIRKTKPVPRRFRWQEVA